MRIEDQGLSLSTYIGVILSTVIYTKQLHFPFQECCKSCADKFENITESLNLLEEEVGFLKRRIRKLKKSSADREIDDC